MLRAPCLQSDGVEQAHQMCWSLFFFSSSSLHPKAKLLILQPPGDMWRNHDHENIAPCLPDRLSLLPRLMKDAEEGRKELSKYSPCSVLWGRKASVASRLAQASAARCCFLSFCCSSRGYREAHRFFPGPTASWPCVRTQGMMKRALCFPAPFRWLVNKEGSLSGRCFLLLPRSVLVAWKERLPRESKLRNSSKASARLAVNRGLVRACHQAPFEQCMRVKSFC